MKNKSKLGLSLLTGLTTLSVATPLATSCGKITKEHTNHVHESEEDKLYGINAYTYESLKKDYISKLQEDMIQHGIREDSEEWKQSMNDLNHSLEIFNDVSTSTYMSYGELTSSLMTYAKRTNGLTLHRTTNAKPSDVDDMYQGARNSFDLYMDQLGFSSSLKAAVLKSADGKFATLKTQLQAKGIMENDPYGALQEAKGSLLDCFEIINAEISRFASILTITNFKKLYSMTLKEESLEYIQNNLVVGQQIDDASVNQIFDVIDVENGTTTTFRNDIMTGYVLKPTLQSLTIDNYTNNHQVKISWSCVSNTYLQTNDAETIKTATAYLYDVPSKEKLTNYFKSGSRGIDEFFNILAPRPDILCSNFSIEKENENIGKTYFDTTSSHISFKFPEATDSRAKLDPFYSGISGIKVVDGQTVDGDISLAQLAETGIMISFDNENYEYLTDVLKSTTEQDYNYSEATLAQKFVTNCEINAIVHEADPNTHKIDVTLYAKYKNSTNASSETNKLFYVGKMSCVNYPITEETFQQFSRDFTSAYEYVSLFGPRKIRNNIYLAGEIWGIVNSTIALTIIGFSVWSLVMDILEHNIDRIDFSILDLAAACASFAICCWISVANGKRNKEITDFQKSLDSFWKTPVAKEMSEKMNEGSKIFVRYIGPDYKKHVETDEQYKAKYEVFSHGDIHYYQNLDNFYKAIPSSESEFNKLAKKMKVDRDTYNHVLDTSSSQDAKFWGTKFGLVVSYILDAIAIIGILAQRDISPFNAVNNSPANDFGILPDGIKYTIGYLFDNFQKRVVLFDSIADQQDVYVLSKKHILQGELINQELLLQQVIQPDFSPIKDMTRKDVNNIFGACDGLLNLFGTNIDECLHIYRSK